MKGRGPENKADYEYPVQEVSEKSINKRPRDHPCDIGKGCDYFFCPHPKNLPEAKLKSFGLMALAEEISRLPSIDCLVAVSVYSYADL